MGAPFDYYIDIDDYFDMIDQISPSIFLGGAG
jgi:hypothetical protein